MSDQAIADPARPPNPAAPVRLARYRITLPGGQRVGVSTGGHGIPLVAIHGFGVESLLYAQPLARLAASGFRVVAIDLPGHGDTDRLPGLPTFEEHVGVVAAALDELGIRRALFMGHSMGGRVVAEIAAREPWRALGLLLLAPIVGAPWERWRTALRWMPPAIALYGVAFALDTIETVPVFADTRQALKLSSRVRRSALHHASRPWRGLVPGQAILRAPTSAPALDAIARAGVPTWVVHGERDRMVPHEAGAHTARHVGGELVTVLGGTHSWMLTCPESLPAIVGELRDGLLGQVLGGVDASECVRSTSQLDALVVGAETVRLETPRTSARLTWTRAAFVR